jgi:cytoskeletal protein CcmA (bactofilin family)
MNPKKPQNGSALSLNVISEETHLEGNITSTSDFRIAGRVYGDLDIKGKLLLTSEAVIRGEIRVDQADISGSIRGEVIASDKVVLRGNAKLNGNIYTRVLVIEEGAYFQGECHMTEDLPRKIIENVESDDSEQEQDQDPQE